jgi:hypothetical protein
MCVDIRTLTRVLLLLLLTPCYHLEPAQQLQETYSGTLETMKHIGDVVESLYEKVCTLSTLRTSPIACADGHLLIRLRRPSCHEQEGATTAIHDRLPPAIFRQQHQADYDRDSICESTQSLSPAAIKAVAGVPFAMPCPPARSTARHSSESEQSVLRAVPASSPCTEHATEPSPGQQPVLPQPCACPAPLFLGLASRQRRPLSLEAGLHVQVRRAPTAATVVLRLTPLCARDRLRAVLDASATPAISPVPTKAIGRPASSLLLPILSGLLA